MRMYCSYVFRLKSEMGKQILIIENIFESCNTNSQFSEKFEIYNWILI